MTKPMTKTAPKPQTTRPLEKLARILPWILIVCGVVGIIASVMITVEKIDLIQNPNYQPVCDLNPIISCGNVMKSSQSHVFGFTNTYIGLVGFPIVLAIGMAMLAGAKFKRWYWLGLEAGLTFGIGLAYWLLFESVFRIHSLCPYCLSVDVVITVAWWYTTLFIFHNGYLRLSTRFKQIGLFAKQHHADILIFWFAIVIAVILHHFWYYFGQHL